MMQHPWRFRDVHAYPAAAIAMWSGVHCTQNEYLSFLSVVYVAVTTQVLKSASYHKLQKMNELLAAKMLKMDIASWKNFKSVRLLAAPTVSLIWVLCRIFNVSGLVFDLHKRKKILQKLTSFFISFSYLLQYKTNTLGIAEKSQSIAVQFAHWIVLFIVAILSWKLILTYLHFFDMLS